MTIAKIKNVGRAGARVIYDRRGKPIRLSPGEERAVDLSDGMARYLMKNRDKSLEVTTEGIEQADVSFAKRAADIGGNAGGDDGDTGGDDGDTGGGVDHGGGDSAPDTAKRLLALVEAKEIEHPDLVRRAKAVVGRENWPGGVPKKSKILALLKEKSESED